MNWIRSFIISSLILFASLPALAQDDFVRKEAEQRFHEGTALLDQGKNEQARAKFLQAYATSKVPNVVFNLARAEHLTGHRLEAARHYREYLRIADPKKVTSRERAKLDGWLTQLREKLGRILVTAPRGSIVSIDGERIEEADLEGGVEVSPGPHKITANGWGKDKTVESQAPAGVVTEVTFSFAEPAPAPAPTPQPPPNPHANDTVVPPPPLARATTHESSDTHWLVAGGLLVGAAISTGVGIGFGLASHSSVNEAESLRRSSPGLCASASSICDNYHAKASDADHQATISTLGYIGGGAFLAGVVVSYLLLKPDPSIRGSSGSTVVLPTIGVNGGGAVVQTHF